MRSSLFAAVCVLLSLLPLSNTCAQLQFGARAGITPANALSHNHVVVNGELTALTFNTMRAGTEVYAGITARWWLDNGFFVESDLLYNHQSTDYIINFLDNDVPDLPARDVTHHLVLPLTVGIEIRSVEFTSGLVARLQVRHRSDLDDVRGYVDDLPLILAGYHAGIGYHYGNVLFRLSYQMDFSNYGSGMFISGTELKLDDARNRLVATATYLF
ncbi:MAG: hypothetical protein R3301_03560 [Saprospiraceae bacterium]|nr:hypothetical protein [Saprospiraceae bacterium]